MFVSYFGLSASHLHASHFFDCYCKKIDSHFPLLPIHAPKSLILVLGSWFLASGSWFLVLGSFNA